MAREIKFRTFIEKEMVLLPMAALQYFDFEGSYALCFVVDGYSDFWAHEHYENATKKYCTNAPIMQFTGLKDKNGKNIYEGDIINCTEGYYNDFEYIETQTFNNAVVGYHRSSFYYFPKGNMKQPHQILDLANSIVVVGNIYQNPELLNPSS